MLEKAGARYRTEAGAEVPADFGSSAGELSALRRQCVIVDRSARGRISLTGSDAVAFLQALFTNDVVKPAAGRIIYGFFLTPQGRVVGDARVLRRDGAVWLDTDPAARANVLAFLNKYHVSERVTITDRTADTALASVFGPKAPTVIEFALGAERVPDAGAFTDNEVCVAANELTGEAGFDLFTDATAAPALYARLAGPQTVPAGWDALETARIEAGVPRFGVEFGPTEIPLETGLGAAGIAFDKGCYVGQEIIARMDARGAAARRLVGFSVDGALPAPGTAVHQGEREVGVIKSAVVSPSLRGRPIAMGYVHKDVPDRAEDLTAGDAHLWIVPRPFYPPQH